MSLRYAVLLGVIALSSFARGQSLIVPAYYAVTGAPFSATVKAEWDGSLRGGPGESISRVWRDDAGRQRFERVVGNRVRVTIYDPVKGQMIMLDPEARTATVTTMAHVGQAVALDLRAGLERTCHAGPGWEDLGKQTIAGLETCGQKKDDRELWLSTAYRMPLMSVTSDAGHGVVTESVVAMLAGQPDERLFEVPEGYKVNGSRSKSVLGNVAASASPGGGVYTAPVVVDLPKARYTAAALRLHKSGSVVISLRVLRDGSTSDVRVVRGLGYGLDENAIEAGKLYKFKPATRDGMPVEAELNFRVTFSTNEP